MYEVLGISKEANDADIKKAYRKQSLKVHPDRADEKDKETATRAFQTLSKVHFILTDKNHRQTYDETGIVPSDDSFESKADWQEYWRLLFPKVTVKDIDNFLKKYTDSDEEKQDLKKFYLRFKGDMDSISQCIIGFDEERTRKMIQEMIVNEEVPKFANFVNESETKRQKRAKRAAKEAKLAEKESKKVKSGDNDLALAIRSRAQNGFEDMIANLEAKYANNDKKGKTKSKGSKRK